MTGQYKPIVAKEFPPNTSLPQLYLNHSSRTVFAPKSCSDTQEQLIEQLENSAASGMISMTTAPLQTQQRPLSTKARLFAPKEPAQARKNPSNKKRKGTETGESRSRKRQNVYGLAFYTRSGYCENCCEKYDEFEKHIRSEKHRKWASNENNFAALDVLIKKIGRTPIEGHFEDPLAERNITSEFCSELAGISDESAQSPQLEEDEENFEYQNENVMDAKEASSDKPNQEIIDMSSPRKLVEPHETETKKAVGVNILYQCFNATDDQDETWTPNEMDASKHKKHQPTPADIIGDEDEEEILNSDGSYCEEIEPSQDITKSQFIVSHENEQADAAEDVHIDNLLHNSDELSHEELDIKLSNLPAVHVDDSFVSLDIQMGAPTTAVPDTTLSADNANTSKNLKPFSATVISSASAVCLDGGEIRAPVQQKSNPSGDKSPTLAETDESPRPKKLFRRNTPVYSANLLVSDSQEISVPVKLPFVHQILTDHDSHGDTESKGDENLICPIGKIGYSSEYEPVVLPTGVSTTPRAIVENKSTRVDCAGDNWAAISSPRVHAALTHSGRRQCMKQNVLGASHLSSTIDSAQHTPTKSGKKLLGGRVQELGSKTSLEIQGQLSQPSSFTFSKSLSAIAQDNVEGFHTSFASLLGDLPEPESPAKSLAAPGLISSALNSTPKFRKSKRVAASPLGLSPSIRPSRHNVQISPSHAAQLKPNACILSSGQATPKLRKQCDEFTQFSTPSRFQAYTNQPSHDASSPCDQH